MNTTLTTLANPRAETLHGSTKIRTSFASLTRDNATYRQPCMEHIQSIIEQNPVQCLSFGLVYSNCETQPNGKLDPSYRNTLLRDKSESYSWYEMFYPVC